MLSVIAHLTSLALVILAGACILLLTNAEQSRIGWVARLLVLAALAGLTA